MRTYLVRRVLYLVPVWLGVSLLAFGLGRLAPGDPARDVLARTTGRQPTQHEVVAERHRLGLDRALLVQYLSWLGGALRADLGTSYTTGEPVAQAIGRTLPATLELAGQRSCWRSGSGCRSGSWRRPGAGAGSTT